VRAKTSVGPGTPSSVQPFRTTGETPTSGMITKPGVPTLIASPIGTSYTANWSRPRDWGTGSLESRKYEYRNTMLPTDSGGGEGSWTEVDDSVTTVTISGLQVETRYLFEVRATTGTQTSDASSRQITTLKPIRAPGVPTNVVATGGFRRIDLTWDPPDDDGGSPIISYRIGVSTDGFNFIISTTGRGDPRTFARVNLEDNERRWFQIQAVSERGGAGPAASVSASTGRFVADYTFRKKYESQPLTTTHLENNEFGILGNTLIVADDQGGEAGSLAAVRSGAYFWVAQGRTTFLFRVTSAGTPGTITATGRTYYSFGIRGIEPAWTRNSDDSTIRPINFGRLVTS